VRRREGSPERGDKVGLRMARCRKQRQINLDRYPRRKGDVLPCKLNAVAGGAAAAFTLLVRIGQVQIGHLPAMSGLFRVKAGHGAMRIAMHGMTAGFSSMGMTDDPGAAGQRRRGRHGQRQNYRRDLSCRSDHAASCPMAKTRRFPGAGNSFGTIIQVTSASRNHRRGPS
jgi:hypothetical protein